MDNGASLVVAEIDGRGVLEVDEVASGVEAENGMGG